MTDTTIHIDKLRLRVRGVGPDVARAALSGIGPELAQRLLPHLGDAGSRPPIRALRLASVSIAEGDAASLRSAVADALARGILQRQRPGGGGT